MSQSPGHALDQKNLYWGHHVRGIDKGRVMLPQEWRPAESPREFVLLFWPVPALEYLLVLVPEDWSGIQRKLQAARLSDENAAEIERQISQRFFKGSLDNYGRLLLPEDTGAILNVTDKVALVGRFNKFEIWNPEKRPKLTEARRSARSNPKLIKKTLAIIGI